VLGEELGGDVARRAWPDSLRRSSTEMTMTLAMPTSSETEPRPTNRLLNAALAPALC
jgi:hypothetical protein